MTHQKIYDLYLERFKTVFAEDNKPLSFPAVKKSISFFNLRCRSLKKDTCTTFTNKKLVVKYAEKEELIKEKENHFKKA